MNEFMTVTEDFDVAQMVENAPAPAWTSIEVHNRIAAITKLEKDIEAAKQQRDQYAEYFRNRIETKEEYIKSLKRSIMDYLKIIGKNSMPTPIGTAVISHITKYSYDEQEILKTLSTLPAEERARYIRIKEEINKTALKEAHGFPGVDTREEDILIVRK